MVFGQLITAIYNMKEFEIDNSLILKIITSFSNQHCLSKELNETLINTINNIDQ